MSSRPRLLVATEVPGSGLGRFAVELANALESNGVEVTFVSPPQSCPVHTTLTKELPVPVGRRRIDKIWALCRSSLAVAAQVLRLAGQRQPLLLVHLTTTLPVSLAPIFAAKLKRAPVALSLHDFYPHTMRFPPALHGLERWFYRFGYRRCDIILTNNEVQTRRLIAEARVPAARIRTLFHGAFTVAGLAMPDAGQPLRLLVFGSLRPNKQVLESIRAVAMLRAEGLAVELRIAGAPRREDAAYWQACLAALPADGKGFEVEARFIAEDELQTVLSGVDAMLCPYVGFDSQSGVAVTAISNAIPIIASRDVTVAGVDISDVAWPPVEARADAEAVARAIRAFEHVPRPQRQRQAEALQRQFLAQAGWNRLAELYIDALVCIGLENA